MSLNSLEIQTRQEDDTLVLSLKGNLLYETTGALRGALTRFLLSESPSVMIDLKDTEWVDSSGVNVLLHYYMKAKAMRRLLTVRVSPQYPRRNPSMRLISSCLPVTEDRPYEN